MDLHALARHEYKPPLHFSLLSVKWRVLYHWQTSMSESADWRESAFELYRLTWSALTEWRKLDRADLDYWIEELREALLDLKEATISDDEARAHAGLSEVRTLIAELDRLTRGGHD